MKPVTENTKKWKQNLVQYSIYLTLGFILLSAALSFWNRYVTYDTRAIIERTEQIKSLVNAIQSELINPVLLSLYGFENTRDEKQLAAYQKAQHLKDSIFSALSTQLYFQGFERGRLEAVEKSVHSFLAEAKKSVTQLKEGNLEKLTIAYRDKQLLETFKKDIFKFQNEIKLHAQSDYEWSIVDNAIIQIILVLLSLPILITAGNRLSREVKNNKDLLAQLHETNKTYLYHDGQEIMESKVIEKSINSLKTAFDFVKHVAKSEHEAAKNMLPEETRELNKGTLMGALLEMSTKLQKNEEEDKQRQWSAEGLNKFYEIVRNNQGDLKLLADRSVSFLVNYLKAQQASLLVKKVNEEETYLELVAAYAFERKKWIEKRVEIGEGLLGQAYLEGDPILMTDIPKGYLSITSGLGDAPPRCLLIVPFKYHDKIEALFEIAAFQKFNQHQIDLLKKVGEFFAASMQNVNNNLTMKKLLEQSQQQAEIMKEQEEELRQNMEELEATNEAMRRREQEMAKNVTQPSDSPFLRAS